MPPGPESVDFWISSEFYLPQIFTILCVPSHGGKVNIVTSASKTASQNGDSLELDRDL